MESAYKVRKLAALTFGLQLLAGCAGDGSTGGSGDRADDIDPAQFACVIDDRSGRTGQEQTPITDPRQRLAQLNDPLANLVLKDPRLGCPEGFGEMMAKLRVTDADKCQFTDTEMTDADGTVLPADAQRNGTRTAFVSELAQLKIKPCSGDPEMLAGADAAGRPCAVKCSTQQERESGTRRVGDKDLACTDGDAFLVDRFSVPASYRAVVERTCNEREEFGLVMSLFGLSEESQALPQNLEVMAFDEEAGVFNYYVKEPGSAWEWHGDSTDILDLDENNATNRCGNCHNGGGPIQKELDSPWVHWEHSSGEKIKGTRKMIARFPDLGAKSRLEGSNTDFDGKDVEVEIVKPGVRAYNKKGRLNYLLGRRADGDTRPATVNVQEMLEPLFCAVEINLQSGTFLSSFFTTQELKSVSLSLDSSTYQQLIAEPAFAQEIPGLPADVVNDTHREFTFPERSFADMNWVETLVQEKLIDDDLVKDVLAIDFTRPVFSEMRCNLLREADRSGAFESFASAEDVTPGGIKSNLARALEGSSAPGAAELVASLNNPDDAADHQAKVGAFGEACKTRQNATDPEDAKGFVRDVLRVLSWKRRRAAAREGAHPQGPHRIIEFPQTMATDRLRENVHFDATCQVVVDD